MNLAYIMLRSNKLNILVAYPYFTKNVYKFLMDTDPSTFRLIIDSGAFTAWNTGKQIDMESYCKFLKTIPTSWERKIVQLDVYGNPEQTYTNYMRMLDMGYVDIMPVFTRGDTVERLEEFYKYTDYIMFGGIAIGGENRNYVKWFCDINKGRKAHWLGFVNVPFIKHFKPYSVDSSSASSTERYGFIHYTVGKGEMKSRHRKLFTQPPPQEFIKHIMKSGFTLKEILTLQKEESWNGKATAPNKNPNGLASFITLTNHLKRAFDVENNLGTKIYLAYNGSNGLQSAYESLKFLKERKVI